MPEGFWVKGYWGVRSPEPIKTILVKRGAETITNIQIERSAKPIKTTDATTQAPPLALLLARVHTLCISLLEHTAQLVHIFSRYSYYLLEQLLTLILTL